MLLLLVDGISVPPQVLSLTLALIGTLGTVISTIAFKFYTTLQKELGEKAKSIVEKEKQLQEYRVTVKNFSDQVHLIRDNEKLKVALEEYKEKEKSLYELYIAKFEALATFISNLESIGK